jgi:DNA-binding transcriptional LysR family regulator
MSTGDSLAQLASHDMNLLVPLLALLEEGNVTRAAARVGISQPAMSHTLRRARTLIGDELLIRRGNSTVITARGNRLITPLRDVLAQVSGLLEYQSFAPETDTRTVTISATTTTAYVIVPHLIKALTSAAPGMSLVVKASATYQAADYFENDDVDIVLLADKLTTPYKREHLYTDRWVAVGAAGNPALGSGLTSELMGTLEYVVFRAGPTSRPSPYMAMDALGIRRNVRAYVDDFLLIPHLVASSNAIAIVQELAARRLVHDLAIEIHELPFDASPLGIDAVWNPRIGNHPFRAWFGGLLSRAAAEASAFTK